MKDGEARVSVIIPCYNAQAYLPACVHSVLRQTGCLIEVLLVDDGSSDATGRILDDFAERDSRVRVWHGENRGASAARNLALANARGEWVTFVDADDLLPEGALVRMLAQADGETDVVIAAHETLDERGNRTACAPERFFDPRDMRAARDRVARRLIEGDCVYNIMCAKLHRRSHLQRQGVRLCESVRIGEDALFNFQSLYTARRFVYTPEVCYTYRVHALSAMRQSEGREFERMRPFFRALGELLDQMGLYPVYFPALAASATLRLYKESGLGGVVRRFDSCVRPLLNVQKARGVSAYLVRRGLYPYAYAAAFPFAALRRKAWALVGRMRHG